MSCVADELSVVALTLCRNAQKWKSTREKGRRQQNAETNSCRQAERPDDELRKHRRCRGGIGNRSFRHHHHKGGAQNTPIEMKDGDDSSRMETLQEIIFGGVTASIIESGRHGRDRG